MTERYRALILCLLLFAAGCAGNPQTTPPIVPGVVVDAILVDLIDELTRLYPPATTKLALSGETPRGLEDKLRNQGYALHQGGDQSQVSVSAYYLPETGLYLGILRLGIDYTLARKYVWDNGHLQPGATTVASTDG